MGSQELMSGLVEQFVQRTLDGSLCPVRHLLLEANRLTEAEMAELSVLSRSFSRRKDDAR